VTWTVAVVVALTGLAPPQAVAVTTGIAPPPEITRAPPAVTRRTSATFVFASDGAEGYECKVNRGDFAPCSTPFHLEGLTSRAHRFSVRALYAGGTARSERATHEWRVDTVAPTAELTGWGHAGDRTRLRARWDTADRGSGVASSDVRWRMADRLDAMGPWRRPPRLQATTSTSAVLRDVRPGRRYCVAARARDGAGNTSPWTTPQCFLTRREVRTTAEGFRYAAATGPVFGAQGALHRYSAEVQPGTDFSANEFAVLVDRYLGDPRGWSKGSSIRMQRVHPGNARIRVVLATPATVDRYCAGVANTAGMFSCWNGRFAMINANRWHYGADKFRGTLGQYRGYVLNHEVGHAFGHRHRSCPGAGGPAPVGG
jgi:hypothetical protein